MRSDGNAAAAARSVRRTARTPVARATRGRPRIGPAARPPTLRSTGAASGQYTRCAMPHERPPTIDPIAAARWAHAAPARSPWLHEEVARRMADRLQWIRLEPRAWADWEPVRGGLEGHALVQRRYPRAESFVAEPQPARARVAAQRLARPWWRRFTTPS